MRIPPTGSRSTHYVTAFIAELPSLSDRVKLQEGRAAHPLIGRVRLAGVGIGNQVGPAGVKAADLGRASLQRDVGAVVHVKGVPVERLVMVFSCHPFSRKAAAGENCFQRGSA
jgi:hypothetical protein